MMIFLPLGDIVKEAAERLRAFHLDRCPCCEAPCPLFVCIRWRQVPVGLKPSVSGGKGRHGDVVPEEVVPVPLLRYRCHRRNCRAVITVSAESLVKGGVYPVAVRELVAEEYLSGRATYGQIAEQVGCSASTAWRWMRALTWRSAIWLQACREWLAAEGEPTAEVELRQDLRALWQRRRVRAAGMLDGLLVAEALGSWIDRLRAKWRRWERVLPRGRWGFGLHVLDALTAGATPQTESRAPP